MVYVSIEGFVPSAEDAKELLRALAAQVKPLMKEYGFAINSLDEYEYNRVFLGRNWNNGETVELVLRRADGTFFGTDMLLDTFCHELAHSKYMDHSRPFHKLWAELRSKVIALQQKGYYGDGFWSSGQRLQDSSLARGDGVGGLADILPEYICGGAHSQKRAGYMRSRRARRPRKEVVPSLHTGAQTAKKRKPGGRLNKELPGEGVKLSDEGGSRGKQAQSKRAREERALAVERRLKALQEQPGPSEPSRSREAENEDEEDFEPEDDDFRRLTMLEAFSAEELDQMRLGSSATANPTSPLKTDKSAQTPSDKSLGKRPAQFTAKDDTSPEIIGVSETPLDSTQAKRRKMGKSLVTEEITHRNREKLGMTGPGKRLGTGKTRQATLEEAHGVKAGSSGPSTQTRVTAQWTCNTCTLLRYTTTSSLSFYSTMATNGGNLWVSSNNVFQRQPSQAVAQTPATTTGSTQADPELAALASAKAAIQTQLLKDDSAVPDLKTSLIASAGAGSGAYSYVQNDAWTPFTALKYIPLPPAIFDLARTMGLLPEIDRAWVTFNETLHLWDYLEGGPSSYDSYHVEGAENIHHVALVPAKPGVFVDSIGYVLVICRAASVELVGISAPAGSSAPGVLPRRELTMFETDIKIATPMAMSTVVGTPEGRVFLAGGAALYELTYQASDRWFSKKVELINHSVGSWSQILPLGGSTTDDIIQLAFDNSRRSLYGLTQNVRIVYWQVPLDQPKAVTRVNTVVNIADDAAAMCPGGKNLLARQNIAMAHIHALEVSESKDIRLIATSTNGVRFYFEKQPYVIDQRLRLAYVRLPPTGLPDPFADAPQTSYNSRYGDASVAPPTWTPAEIGFVAHKLGLLTAGAITHGLEGLLLCTAPDLPSLGKFGTDGVQLAQQQPGQLAMSQYQPMAGGPLVLKEWACLIPLEGQVCAVVPNPSVPPSSMAAGWNENVTQFSGPPLSFLVLSNCGLTLLSRKRPVQTLLNLFEEFGRSADGNPILEFRELYGTTQSLAMALAIASENSFIWPPSNPHSAVAQETFMTNCAYTSTDAVTSVKHVARDFVLEFGGRATPSDARYAGQPPRFSLKYEALTLYFSRLVRPMWKEKIAKGTAANPSSNISPAVLTSIQGNLERLKTFLTSQPQLFLPGTAAYDGRGGFGPADQEAWKAEHAAANQFQTLLNQTIEAISFILLLIDYNMPLTLSRMDPPLQQAFFGLAYDDFLTSQNGRDTARRLVTAVINQQISQQISVDAISQVLQERCGSFCSPDDVMLHKAQEQIRRAKEAAPGPERLNALDQSLKLFERGTKNMAIERLQSICKDYQDLHYAWGLVVLPLKCAEDWDVDERGAAYFNAGSPPNDPRADDLAKRNACYQCIIDSLKGFADASNAAVAANESTKAADLDTVFQRALTIALRSQDFVFHAYLYDWVISKDDGSELIEMSSPFVEQYLTHQPLTRQKMELLWQFYVQQGRYMDAAKTLALLAESMNFGLKLDERVEYLSRAISNAKSTSMDGSRRHDSDAEFLSDLQDKLDVASVQLEILPRVYRVVPDSSKSPQVLDLATRLMTISELYSDYADPLGLEDMKLLILHTSEHNDMSLVTSIWRSILDQDKDHGDSFVVLGARVAELGRRFYPSEIAYPLEILSEMLETYTLERKEEAPTAWALRVLVEGGVPHEIVLDYFDHIKDSGVPPYQDPVAIHHVLNDITTFVQEWLDEALRPGSRFAKAAFPAGKVEDLVSRYLAALRLQGDDEIKRRLLDIQSKRDGV
ncbi:hypothetical protein FRB90_001413 [Tulasnella sp. 427]|nr:hypothetical protein FRB90_001413 [Tulasnella sp. 427]